ncbi:methyltransferase domain-containing protein [candidate division KSB1 bacterium]|nr:methyltransferase domain-containing protein [candidate division KSB1 bacterium]
MNPANNPNINYKTLVRDSYNKCAQKYASSRQENANPELALLIDRLPENANILDIGCGGGVPVAKKLAEHGNVFGIDISQTMIALAQKNVPSGVFTCLDIMQAEFPESFF